MIRCYGVLVNVAKYGIEMVNNVAQVYLSESRNKAVSYPVGA